MLKIAIDVMGADNGVKPIVEGVIAGKCLIISTLSQATTNNPLTQGA